MVLIAHRLSTVVNATQIAVVNQGRIVEVGTHAALCNLGGIYAHLVSRQMQRDADKIVQWGPLQPHRYRCCYAFQMGIFAEESE